MPEMDERLQRYLNALEQGEPLEHVLETIPEEASELKGLVRLAATIRTLPHPEPLLEGSEARQQVISAARQAQNHNNRRTASTFPRARLENRPQARKWPRWAPLPVAAVGVGLLFCIFFTFLAFQVWLPAPYGAQAATVIDVIGQVEAAPGAAVEADGWQALSDGSQVNSGLQIRTGAASSATLVFFDGSRTILGPHTRLALSALDGKRGAVLQVSLKQLAGRTTHSVVPLRGDQAYFLVETPSGTARVRGTRFEVRVAPSGQARFMVDYGEVQVSNGEAQVALTSGQATTSSVGQAPEAPAYAFRIQGPVEAVQPQAWQDAGLPFQVAGDLLAGLDPEKGVLIEGRVQPDGDWVADIVEAVEASAASPGAGQPQGSFSGVLQAMQGDLWQVGGVDVRLEATAKIGQGVAQGRAVQVSFTLPHDQGVVATQLASLDEPPPQPAPDPDAKPSLSFEPDELEISGCMDENGQPAFVFPGRLVNTADEAKDIAADVVLGYATVAGDEYVDEVAIDPVSWIQIEAGQEVEFTVRVTLKPEWAALPNRNEVKLRVFVAHELNRPDHHRGRLTLTVVSNCGGTGTPSATPTITATATMTPSVTATPTFTPTGTITVTETLTPSVTPTGTATPTGTVTATPGSTDCTGADPHPEGTRLAERYEVPYEEIMGWFCQGYGFGEIDLAYELSRAAGVPVEQIFEMRSSGMGWGEIKKIFTPAPPKGKPTKRP